MMKRMAYIMSTKTGCIIADGLQSATVSIRWRGVK